MAGIDLAQVKKLYVGVGDRSLPPPGTLGPIGDLYVDDIGLCVGRCEPAQGPAGDVSGDCVVDFVDHALKAQSYSGSGAWWLDYADLADTWLDEILVWP
jgi:hypothetical protein